MRPPLSETRGARVDPLVVDVVEGSLESALREIELQVERTARSANIREVGDHVPAIFDAAGRGLRECRSPEVSVASPTLGAMDAVGYRIPDLCAAEQVAGMAGGRISGRAALDSTMLGPRLYRGRVVGAALAGDPPSPA
jgi:N-methylhydantoinase B/oxoprolinase/acetone carboxylase alpha subunit